MTKQFSSTTPYPDPRIVPEPFKPSVAQKERAAALKRFNRLYVLGPVIVFSVISFLIIIFMIIAVLVMSFNDDINAQYLSFISGLADITLILFIIPLIILMISGPALLIGMINKSRNRRRLGKPAFDQGGKLQVLLWKMDNLVKKSQTKTNEVAPKMAEQVIRFNESIAYAQGFFKQIIRFFTRS
jgi:hypothetical protein